MWCFLCFCCSCGGGLCSVFVVTAVVVGTPRFSQGTDSCRLISCCGSFVGVVGGGDVVGVEELGKNTVRCKVYTFFLS